MKYLLFAFTLLLIILFPASLSVAEPVLVDTVIQKQVRPSYPFPDFLSTGPYVWYNDADNQPIKGHAYRISTFTEENSYKIFIEKIQFGLDGCCLEIIDYRQLLINEEILKLHFPRYVGKHGFKLIRWTAPEAFELNAYGGNYTLSMISSDNPVIKDNYPK